MKAFRVAAVLALALCGCAAEADSAWTPAALADLKAAAAAAPAEGLPPETAALDELARFEATAQTDSTAAAQVDLAAETLFDSLARSFTDGALDPTNADRDWAIEAPTAPDLPSLHAALASGAMPGPLLRALLPQSAEYAALRAELARTMAEPAGALDQNGLDRDTRIVRLRANLERWRWLPRDLPARRIEVRIAQAEAILHRDGAPTATHIAIVGAQRSQTPSFIAEINSITLNPSWTPPNSIFQNELLPRFRRDPSARDGYDVIDEHGAVIAPGDVDWSARPFPYRVRQRPGPGNALGRIRFNLPNRFAIYLHDTPNHALFARDRRTLSHGCIRIDDPLGLAESALDNPAWTPAALQAAIDTGVSQDIPVSPALPVYVLYLTASARDDGSVAYYDDVYGRDSVLVAQLDAPDAALVAATSSPPRCAA